MMMMCERKIARVCLWLHVKLDLIYFAAQKGHAGSAKRQREIGEWRRLGAGG